MVIPKRKGQMFVVLGLIVVVMILALVVLSFASDLEKTKTIYRYSKASRSTQGLEGLRQLYVPNVAEYSFVTYSSLVGPYGGVDTGHASASGARVMSGSAVLSRKRGTSGAPPTLGVIYWGDLSGNMLEKKPPYVFYDPSQFPLYLKPGDVSVFSPPSGCASRYRSVLVSVVFINESYTVTLSTSLETLTVGETGSYVLSMNPTITDSVSVRVGKGPYPGSVVIVERVLFSPYGKDFLAGIEDPLRGELEKYRALYSSGYKDIAINPGDSQSWDLMPCPTGAPGEARLVFYKKGDPSFNASSTSVFMGMKKYREAYKEKNVTTHYFDLYQYGLDVLMNWEVDVRDRIVEKIDTLNDKVWGKTDSWGCSYPAPKSASTLLWERNGVDMGDINTLKSRIQERVVDGLDVAESYLERPEIGADLYLVGDIEPNIDLANNYWDTGTYSVVTSTGACCRCTSCATMCGETCGRRCRDYTYYSTYKYGATYTVLIRLYYRDYPPGYKGPSEELVFAVRDSFIDDMYHNIAGVSEDHCPSVSCGGCYPCPVSSSGGGYCIGC